MKTNKWIFAILVVSLGWVACDDDDDNALNKPNLNDTDETFVEMAARSNMAEIEFAELAKTKATDSLVKDFAEEMIDDHTMAQDELEDIADDFGGIEWPNDLDEGDDAIMEQLNDAQGYTFDSLYIKTQVQAHQATTTFFQTATTNTTQARIKAYATKYLPRLQEHLQKVDSLETVIITNHGTDGTD
jgi:putative membrane protein